MFWASKVNRNKNVKSERKVVRIKYQMGISSISCPFIHCYIQRSHALLKPPFSPSSTPYLQEQCGERTNTRNKATNLHLASRTSELRDGSAVGTSARRSGGTDLRSEGSAGASAGGHNGRNSHAAGGVRSGRGDGKRGGGAGGVDAVGESP
jgi:hypothetical protein